MTVLPSTLLVLSIHSTSSGRTGNSVLITVTQAACCPVPKIPFRHRPAFLTLVFLTNVTPVSGKVSPDTEADGCALRLFYTKKQKTPNAQTKLRGDQSHAGCAKQRAKPQLEHRITYRPPISQTTISVTGHYYNTANTWTKLVTFTVSRLADGQGNA